MDIREAAPLIATFLDLGSKRKAGKRKYVRYSTFVIEGYRLDVITTIAFEAKIKLIPYKKDDHTSYDETYIPERKFGFVSEVYVTADKKGNLEECAIDIVRNSQEWRDRVNMLVNRYGKDDGYSVEMSISKTKMIESVGHYEERQIEQWVK